MAKFCSNCGKEVSEGAAFCDGCGNTLSGGTESNSKNLSYYDWFRSLSFKERYIMSMGAIIPILGLIFFCVNINKKPRYAKWCGINALVMFVIYFILFMILSTL